MNHNIQTLASCAYDAQHSFKSINVTYNEDKPMENDKDRKR